MKKLSVYLLGLLAVQCVLALGLYYKNMGVMEKMEAAPLVSLEQQQLDKLVIKDGGNEQQPLTLIKHENGWQIEELFNLPVKQSKLDELFKDLAEAQVSWPVASTSSAQKRFKVDDDDYERSIEFMAGDKSISHLLLGTSPAYRKVHARLSGNQDIYAVGLNTFDIPAKADQWLDKTLIAVKDILSVKAKDYTLVKEGEAWTLNSTADTNVSDASASDASKPVELDQEKAKKLVSALEALTVQSAQLEKPVSDDESNHFFITFSAAKQTYVLDLVQAGEKYYVTRNDRSEVFTLSQYNFDQITEVTYQSLLKEENEESEEGTENLENLEPALNHPALGG